jgi:hypothetical protein
MTFGQANSQIGSTMLQMWIQSGSKVRLLTDTAISSCLLTCPSMRPDITPATQPPPGMSMGPAYGPPQQPQYVYQQPPGGYQGGPPVASGGNQGAGYAYK